MNLQPNLWHALSAEIEQEIWRLGPSFERSCSGCRTDPDVNRALESPLRGIERRNMTTLTNLTASDLRRAADLKEQIEALQAQLNNCLGGGGGHAGNGFVPNRSQPTPRRGRTSKGSKTVADCILEAMKSGKAMSIQDIVSAASRIRGRAVSPGLMSVTLAQLKKAKRIANPARGQYRKP